MELSSISQHLISSFMAWNTPGTSKCQTAAIDKMFRAGCEFYPNKTIADDDSNKEFETDLEFNLMEIPKSYKYCIEDIPEKMGYVKFRFNDDMLTFAKNVGWEVDSNNIKKDLQKQIIHNGYVKPYRLKERAISKTGLHDNDRALELILAVALDVNVTRISLSHHIQEVTQTSIENYFDVLLDEKVIFKISWDLGFVVKLLWWPDVAKEWIERERNWPDKEFIYNHASIGYIITKSSVDEKLEKDTLELRYSFAHVERALISQRSPQQKLVYLIFKSMVCKYLKPLGSIHSFIAKTLMFWTCEKYPPDNLLWETSKSSIVHALTFLFKELLESFEEKHLSYYFLPQINIIENISDELVLKIIVQIKFILSDVKSYIPNNVDKVVDTCTEMLQWVKSICNVVDKIKNKDYSVLIRRPDLIPKFVDIFGSDLKDGSFHFGDVRKRVDSVKENMKNLKLPSVHKEVNYLKDNFKSVERDVKKLFSVVPHMQKEVNNLKGNLKGVEKEAKKMLKKLKF